MNIGSAQLQCLDCKQDKTPHMHLKIFQFAFAPIDSMYRDIVISIAAFQNITNSLQIWSIKVSTQRTLMETKLKMQNPQEIPAWLERSHWFLLLKSRNLIPFSLPFIIWHQKSGFWNSGCMKMFFMSMILIIVYLIRNFLTASFHDVDLMKVSADGTLWRSMFCWQYLRASAWQLSNHLKHGLIFHNRMFPWSCPIFEFGVVCLGMSELDLYYTFIKNSSELPHQ